MCTRARETQRALAPAILALYVLMEGEEREYLVNGTTFSVSVLLSTILVPALIKPAPSSLLLMAFLGQ